MADATSESSTVDTHNLNASSYDAIAEHYHSWSLSHQAKLPATSNPRLVYLDRLLSLLPSPATANVLDLGCGSGVPATQILARRCSKGKVVGVDSSSAMIELARKYVLGEQHDGMDKKREDGKNDIGEGAERDADGNISILADVELKVASMTELAFPSGSFDVVAAFYSVIHLPREQLKGLLERIAGWLIGKDSGSGRQGYLLVNLGTNDDPGSYDNEWLGSTDGHMFWSSFDSATNLKLIAEAGFEIVESAVVEDREDDKSIPFLWVLAKRI